MNYLKAPYNFVPLSKHVVLPHWGEHISHDIPFSDSKSGELRLKITAHSPIFVMDGIKVKETEEEKKKKKAPKIGAFAQFKGRYFIPSSSVKGMLRSILEIMSFSKMGNKVKDNRYAVRDLSGSLKDKYLINFRPNLIRAGWLQKKSDDSYLIKDCGTPGRISHKELATLGVDFDTYFLENGRFNYKDDKEKSAQFKYNQFGNRPREHHFSFEREDAGREIYTIDNGGNRQGKIVFTGQPGPRKRGNNGHCTGHHLEFIFFEEKRELEVPQQVMEDFFFAYYEHDSNRHSDDWKHWRTLLKDGNPIPIFFQIDNDDTIKHLGLSYLYKLPYANSIKETINHTSSEHTTLGIDLSEAIFGYVNEDKKEALKGRVHIGHAFATSGEPDDTVHEHVLSSPKASYYPTYIRQTVSKKGTLSSYMTLMDQTAEVAGWKRYPVHTRNQPTPKTAQPEQKNVAVGFRPLQAGAQFECSIRYHNLRSIELGALISAITFHNSHSGKLFHSLGMAKPLGYGKVTVTLAGMTAEDQHTCLKDFEAYMNANIRQDWHKSEQIRELFTMVAEQENRDSSELRYMQLGRGKKNNHFVEAKSNKEVLDYYSHFEGIQELTATSLITEADMAAMNAQIQKELPIYQKKQPLEQVIEDYKEQKKADLYQALKAKKEKLLEALMNRKKAIAQQQKDAEQEQRKAKWEQERRAAHQAGFDFSQINPSSKKAFDDDLKKPLERHLQIYYGNTKYDSLKAEHPQGMLPVSYLGDLKTLVQNIFNTRNRKERQKWTLQFEKNAIFRKIAEWVGEETARKWLDELQ